MTAAGGGGFSFGAPAPPGGGGGGPGFVGGPSAASSSPSPPDDGSVRALAWDPTGPASLSLCPLPAQNGTATKNDGEAGLDVFLGVGPDAALAAAAARAAGCTVAALPDAEAAGSWLATHARSGDAVLLKGSRAIGLERALEALRAGKGVA